MDCGCEKVMVWKKLGLIFEYTPELIGTKSHCQHPSPVLLAGNIYRVYFGSRDENNNTIVFYFDIDLSTLEILSFAKEPILLNGPLGYFDSNGIYPSCVIKKNDEFLMYTLGFTRGESPLYFTRIGLAKSLDGVKFNKYSQSPLLNTSEHDPWLLTGPFVMFDNGVYRMWYVSGYKWEKNLDGSLQSYYHIKYAESEDGIGWKRDGLISIAHTHPGETNIARPWIIKEDGIYKAWFSYNCGKQGYRIGYAESTDGGYKFSRMDHLAGITISDEPWENEAVAYPAVIVHKGKKYMFYNGNKFGKDGIALAVEE
jgi:hypothetical protein